MSVLNESQIVGSSGQDAGYDIENSLRFRRSATAYLQKTPSSAGNRKTYTYSCWVKKSFVAEDVSPHPSQQLLYANDNASSANTNTAIQFLPTNTIRFVEQISGGSPNPEFYLTSSKLFRDTSAWYHVVVAYDTTQSTASNRIKIYINGTQLTAFDSTAYPTLNFEGNVNKTCIHTIGSDVVSGVNGTLDGYMTEVNFIDGQALAPSDFGETDNNGTWIPKKYLGTYGTNGFYLPMKPTTQATGFNTILYAGNSTSQTMTNVGFAPDLVWYKRRGGSNDHTLIDSVRGGANALSANGTAAEYQFGSNDLSFTSTGFTLTDTGTQTNASGQNYVAWCWDAGGSTVTNTNGTIDSQVRANPSTGFSIATWTNESSGDDTVGHGLGVAPKLIITKLRSTSGDWYTQTTAIDGGLDYLKLNDTNAAASLPKALPTADVFTTDMGGTTTAVAYCFADVAGYQKIGSYTGNGSATGVTVTTGFRPAFLLFKNADDTRQWGIVDNTRSPNNPTQSTLEPSTSNAENTSDNFTFTDTGFHASSTDPGSNGNGDNIIYLAIADTRDAQFNFDASGNKNNWTPNNINSNASSDATYDLMSDVPTLTDEDTSNFATLNPNNMAVNTTMTDGNLKASNSVNHATMFPTIIPTTGKYYFECKMAVNAVLGLGFRTDTNKVESAYSDEANKYYFYLNNSNAYRIVETSNTALGANLNNTTSTFQVAIDFDAAKYYFGRDNTWYAADWGTDGDPASGANPSYDLTDGTKMFPFVYVAGGTWSVNFGQQPFTYTPPTGFKKINAYNLPDSTITDGSKHFDTALYTGTGSSLAITGLEFSPDLVWTKGRDVAYSHYLFDSVRGATLRLISNSTGDEAAASGVSSFDSNGFTLGTDVGANNSGSTFVGWNWKAGGTAVSNTAGTIASQVSANPTAGFSVVTYTGNATAGATVGHGLGVAPAMVIVKSRSASESWEIAHQSLAATQTIRLNSTAAASTTADFNNTRPSATVFTIGSYTGTNQNSGNYIAYCFAEVEGYSKISSYTGNGSADGPFIYTGFRPAFIMFRSTILCNWVIVDSARSTFNVMDDSLYPNTSGTEITTITDVDFLSNGFKWRANLPNETNASGQTYIYMAFAENPFKNSNAR